MNNFFLRILSLLIVLLCLVTAAGAAEVTLDNNTLLVKGVDDSIGLGAFSVVLTYSGNVSIQSVEGESGFMVASNIQNGDGQTFIAGISTEGLTGDIPVASVIATGSGDIEVSIRELANVKGDAISYTNEEFTGDVPTPVPGNEVTDSDMSGSHTDKSPSTIPVATAETTPEVSLTATDTPVNTIVHSTTSATQAPTGDIGNPVVSETDSEKPAPTQSPLSITITAISIGSTFIFVRRKIHV